HKLAGGVRLDEVARDHVGADLVCLLELPRQRLQPIRPSGDEREVPAFARDATCERRADSARGSGDERDVQRHASTLPGNCDGPGYHVARVVDSPVRSGHQAWRMANLTLAEFTEAVTALAEHHGVEQLRERLVRMNAFTSRRGLNSPAALAERLHLLTGGLRRQVPATYAFSSLWTDMIGSRLARRAKSSSGSNPTAGTPASTHRTRWPRAARPISTRRSPPTASGLPP